MTEETTPPTPAEVDEFLDSVENWHDSMPFYNDDLGALLKEFRRMRAAAPKMRARRDAALRARDALAQQLHDAVTQRDQAQAGAHFAVDAGARYLQELQKLEATVKGLRERNEILAAAYEGDTEDRLKVKAELGKKILQATAMRSRLAKFSPPLTLEGQITGLQNALDIITSVERERGEAGL